RLYKDEIDRLSQKLQSKRTQNCLISDVTLTSPLKKSHFDGAIRTIDWSLIAIDSTIAARPQTAYRIPVFQGLKKHSRYDNVDYVDVVAEGSISNRPIGSYVFKLGAISGLSFLQIAQLSTMISQNHRIIRFHYK